MTLTQSHLEKMVAVLVYPAMVQGRRHHGETLVVRSCGQARMRQCSSQFRFPQSPHAPFGTWNPENYFPRVKKWCESIYVGILSHLEHSMKHFILYMVLSNAIIRWLKHGSFSAGLHQIAKFENEIFLLDFFIVNSSIRSSADELIWAHLRYAMRLKTQAEDEGNTSNWFIWYALRCASSKHHVTLLSVFTIFFLASQLNVGVWSAWWTIHP